MKGNKLNNLQCNNENYTFKNIYVTYKMPQQWEIFSNKNIARNQENVVTLFQ